MRFATPLIVVLSLSVPLTAQQWIWGHWVQGLGNQPDGERVFARAAFDLPKKPAKASLKITCDNRYQVWVNDKKVGRGTEWQRGQLFNVARHLTKGRNVVAVRGENDGGPAGLLAWLEVGAARVAPTGAAWKTARAAVGGWRTGGFDDGGWKPASILAPLGKGPWGEPGFGGGATNGGRKAGNKGKPQDFAPLPGFEAKEVASGVGSLIALCLDDQDRPIVSVERGPVLRLHDDDKDGIYERDEVYCDLVKSCQGLLYSRGGLYVVGAGPKGPGLYRIEEGDGENPKLIGGFNGGMGEHGPHAIIEGPGDRLYGVIGNHTKLKAEWSSQSPYRPHDQGHPLPRYLDPRGHARNIKSPGGLIYSVDREGKDWRVHAAGFRNTYDIAFNRHGELFAFDSDMEWDIGMPWYRPTRVYHAIDGADFGWRTGSSKWPDIYPDSLPAAIDCGRGSPCGVVLYDNDKFPERFQGALFGADWAQGRILAFHLDAVGDTYKGRTEVLLSGRPLNVTDLAVTKDGALLFTNGGRGTRGSLGKLTYTKPVNKQPVRPRPAARPGPGATIAELADVLRTVDEEHRFSRFAAIVEFRRRDTVPASAGGADDGDLMLNALSGVHRYLTGKQDPSRSLGPDSALATAALNSETPSVRHAGLRLIQRMMMQDFEVPASAIDVVSATYGKGDRLADREAAMILAQAAPDRARPLLLKALIAEKSRAEQIYLAYALRVITEGWTHDDKRRVFEWLVAAQNWSGGASYQGYIGYLRKDFEKLLDDGDKAKMRALLAIKPGQASVHLVKGAPTRDFTRSLDFLRNSLGAERRSLHDGARVFQKACAACHKFGDQGTLVGPDLTAAGSRYTLEDLLTTIVDPSRAISDQYRALDVFTKDDEIFSGLPVSETEKTLTLLQGTGDRVEVSVSDIDTRRFAKTSGMPAGLLDGLSLEEAADLIYYIRSGASRPVPAKSAWRPLFNGKDLSGWSGDPKLWRVENGVVIGELVGGKQNTFLSTDATYGDFVLQYEILLEEGNSGCQFRSERLPEHVMRGYQADAGEQYWGSLYDERGRGMLHQAEKVDWEPAFDKNDWNHFVVEAVGEKIRITMNGCPTVVISDRGAASGHFGFQLHQGKRTAIRLRNVLIRDP